MKLNARLFAPLCLFLTTAMNANAANYCMAIRGNGEIEPAHWGAVANVVERLGLPQAQAGGSSASITMLLLDAIATNKFVADAGEVNPAVSAERAALLIKSLQGFLVEMTNTPQWRDFMALYQRGQELKNPQWVADISSLLENASTLDVETAKQLIAENKDLIKSNYMTGMKLGLISQKSYQQLFESLERLSSGHQDSAAFAMDLKLARFYSGELYRAISVFGSFNAETDDNIFFRPGIVDFERLAQQFGRIADFYSLLNLQDGEKSLWPQFFQTCSKAAKGKTWDELIAAQPECQAQLSAMIQAHFAGAPGNFAARDIGVTIPSFPGIAVLVDSANEDAKNAKAAYEAALDPHFGKNFKLRNPEDVRYGVWGHEDSLNRIGQNLDRTDEKSRRFLNLGQATWAYALGLSPAEPGLSPLKAFVSNGRNMTSAGGWSDLHPVLLLRAAGCQNVVYVTRRGGESLFGQGVAKRLLGFTRDWSLISTSSDDAKKASAKLNNNGDPSDMTSLWSKLYNLANPRSSMKRALNNADAVLCTNWDAFEITGGVKDMIADAYASPYYVRPAGGLTGEGLSPVLDPRAQSTEGFPAYAGCY